MTTRKAPLYAPALRMKAGELEGVRLLAGDVADCVLPRFIVPPFGERDPDMPLPLSMDRVPDISVALSAAWRGRPALIDATYILDEFGRDQASHWLPAMFKMAKAKGVEAIPAAFLTDIADCGTAYLAAIDQTADIKFALLVSSDEMVGSDLHDSLNGALVSLGLKAEECVVVAEFADVEFSEPSIVAPIISGTLEALQECGLWQCIVFQGSHYPDKNPADPGATEFWPRNEWRAWKLAVRFDPTTAEHMIFGDFAADCSRIEFGGTGGKAIRHLRYTVGDSWRVERGPKVGSDREAMHRVYSKIAGSTDFAGAGFSKADAYIAHAAANLNAPHGSAKNWREINTTHHITQVVNDIARVRGISIKAPTVDAEVQMVLPELE
ncbi:beta family protein [Novosphingobium subterraneum]|uniref:beta family protein n=1 Tax=Novosphingobium subterraneum TaxID=48936 RepID=UPI003D00D2CB